MADWYQPPVNIGIPRDAVSDDTAAPSSLSEADVQDGGEVDRVDSIPFGPTWLAPHASASPDLASPYQASGHPCEFGVAAAPIGNNQGDDDSLYGPATRVVTVPPAHTVKDASRRYLNSVLSNIAGIMSGFDGTTNALRMCPGAVVKSQPDLKAPEGAEEFSMAWFGISRAIFIATLAQETREKAALREEVGNEGNAPLSFSVRDARKVFANGLNRILPDIIGNGELARHPRFERECCAFTVEIEAVSKRVMEEWLAEGELPEDLAERYAALARPSATSCESAQPAAPDEAAVQSIADLDCILAVDADHWMASFFPLLQLLKRDGTKRLRPIWADAATLRDLDKEELAFQVYTLCIMKCLLENKDGHTRGVAVPKTWLQKLLDWLVTVQSADHDDGGDGTCAKDHEEAGAGTPGSSRRSTGTSEGEGGTASRDAFTKMLASCPGPIDTFRCVRVAPGQPSKHWLLEEDRATVDVVPEQFFDYLCQLFGGGPRYQMYGDFTMQSSFEASLKPRPLMIEVGFVVEAFENGKRSTQVTTVYVEEAVRHSDLAEVFRLALQLVREEAGLMSSDTLDLFSVAVCRTNALVIDVKDVNMEALRPHMTIHDDAHNVTVADVIARGAKLARERAGTTGAASPAASRAREKEQLSIELRLYSRERTGAAGEGGELASKYEVTPETVARSGVCGLTNIGNTCYMNSALQCLSALRPFREDVMAFPVSRYANATITSAYVRLLSDMWCGQFGSADTRELKEAISRKERRFAGFRQQDANEFIEVMLDRMEEEVNQVAARSYRERLDSDKDIPLAELSQVFWENFLDNNTGFIPRDFFHQSKTLFRCLTCGETSTVFDNNLTLSLDIKEPRVKKAVRVEVLVNRPLSSAKSADAGQEDEETQSGAVDPIRDTIHVHMSVRVASGRHGRVAEDDLKAAVRERLVKNKELQDWLLSPTTVRGSPGARQAGAATEEAFDFTVELLEVAELGTTYAVAQCRPVSTAGLLVYSAQNKIGCDDFHASGGRRGTVPVFRVWYYLKGHRYGSHTTGGNLVYVEDVPPTDDHGDESALLSTALSHATRAIDARNTSSGGTAGEEEETGEAASTAAPAANTVSKHIIARGKRLATDLLRPLSDHEAEDRGDWRGHDSVWGATDYMILPSVPQLGPAAQSEPKRAVVRIKYRKNRKTQLLDVVESSEKDGDAWLHRCRQEAAPAHDLSSSHTNEEQEDGQTSNGEADVKAAAQSPTPRPATNVAIFLLYDDDEFSTAEVPTLGKAISQRYSGGGGADTDGSLLGTDADGEPMCTLYDCLTRAMEPDQLTGDDAWYCPKCKTFRETCVQRGLFRLPPCLVMSFKRFKVVNSYNINKTNTSVSFPVNIDLAPYLDKEARAVPTLNPHTQYKLRGVVYHSGTLHFGHYTASTYHDRLERWVHYNDTHASLEHTDAPSAKGAYILCYERALPSP